MRGNSSAPVQVPRWHRADCTSTHPTTAGFEAAVWSHWQPQGRTARQQPRLRLVRRALRGIATCERSGRKHDTSSQLTTAQWHRRRHHGTSMHRKALCKCAGLSTTTEVVAVVVPSAEISSRGTRTSSAGAAAKMVT